MTRLIAIATIQPPVTGEGVDNAEMLRRGLQLLDDAGRAGADIACFPEYYNVFGLTDDQAMEAARHSNELVETYACHAKQSRMYVILPVLELTDSGFSNSAIVIGRDGTTIGKYAKTHLIQFEVDWYKVRAGTSLPVYELDFGKVAIMTCFDGYFPEVARVLTLNGAEVIFYPGWQSGPSEISWEIQIRARAIDYCVYIARSSFAYENNVAWQPGMLYGRSFIIGPDGTILSDPGHHVGMGWAKIDLDKPRLMQILDKDSNRGEIVEDLRKLLLDYRRPEIYGQIVEGTQFHKY